MDDIVRQAMAKWPNVPHCFGWLALDARGNWRMRDERAQAQDLPGDTIRNPTLLSFIRRNYHSDPEGQWYFQNGPQRVYVDLEVTPFVCHTDPAAGLVLQTGENVTGLDQVLLTSDGDLVFISGSRCALLDDRDLAQALGWLQCEGETANEEQLAAWTQGEDVRLQLAWGGSMWPVERIERNALPQRFGFVKQPRSPA